MATGVPTILGVSQIDFPNEGSLILETRGEVGNDLGDVVFRLKAWDSLAQGNARATPWVRRDASSSLKGCDRTTA